MNDADCVDFLQWALPRLDMRWKGFRKVRGQVCKRVDRRIKELGLAGIEDYRRLLGEEPAEWSHLDEFCRVTISRFYRDRGVFDRIVDDILPSLHRESALLKCWCAGCASGEEPYTLAICAHLVGRPDIEKGEAGAAGDLHVATDSAVDLEILATDADDHMLERARIGCYQRGTLKELPDDVIDEAFDRTDREDEPFCIRAAFRRVVTFRRHDVRDQPPSELFDLILCRNLVFTYFDEDLQRKCLDRIVSVLRPGGALVIGAHEDLPRSDLIEPWFSDDGIYRRAAPDS